MEALSGPGWAERYRQQARWTWPTRQYIYSRLQAAQARRVLEVGCGAGAILTDWIAPRAFSWMPDGAPSQARLLVGIDIDQSALHAAHQATTAGQSSEARQPTAHQKFSGSRQGSDQPSVNTSIALCRAPVERLPFADHTFDLVFCHYFLLWVKHPPAALSEMLRVLRPGGGLAVLAEPDHAARIDYPPPLDAAGQAQAQALQRQGADPHAGRKLRGWLTQSGLLDIETGIMSAQWQQPPTQAELDMEWWVYRQDVDGEADATPVETLAALDDQAWQAGERVLFVPTFYGWGRKPG